MAKSLKSLLSKINLVDLVVFLVLIAVLMCLMKKMNVVEGLCEVNSYNLNKMRNIDPSEWHGEEYDWDIGDATAERLNLNTNPTYENLERWATESCSGFSDSQQRCERYYWSTLSNQYPRGSVGCYQESLGDGTVGTFCPFLNRCTWTPDHSCTSSQAVRDGPDFGPGEGLELVNIKFENEARCNQIDNMDDCRRVDECDWV